MTISIWKVAGLAAISLLCLMGLAVLVGGILHLYQDHLWDDQIRVIQKQQLTQPAKPPEK